MKTTYERFIEANDKLKKCFGAFQADKWSTLSAGEQDAVCKAEKQEVQSFLVNNQLVFSNLIQERLSIVNQ